MQHLQHSHKLLRGVATRLRLTNLGRQWRWVFLSFCAVYVIALLVSRSTGWASGQFLTLHLPILAVLSLAVSALFHRRPTVVDAARRVDVHGQTRDLFLTITKLGDSVGEFQPLVVQSAEKTAQQHHPRQVVQFPWQQPSLQTALVALLVWGGIALFPQFDPFGKVAAAQAAEQRGEKLAVARRATKERMEELKSAEEASEKNAEVAKALEKLKHVLGKMEKGKPAENRAGLASEQKKLGALWRKLSAEKMAEMLTKNSSEQAFGESADASQQKWAKELQEGNANGLRKELAEMQALAEKIKQAKDPAEKAQLQSELKKKAQQMKEFAAEKIQNKALKAALDRALEQLESWKQPGQGKEAEKEALEALKESLELAKAEIKQLELSAKEMKELQEALKTIQMAKQLNDKNKLDGEGEESGMSLEEYQEMYEQMMAEMGDGEGEGNGDGEGLGGGEPEAEDDSGKTNFKNEQSKSAVKAGKMLLTINTKGVPPKDAEAEEVKTQYRDLVRSVKNSAEEAIQQEQIPPGYHDGIKNYFNSLEEAPPEEPAKKSK